LPERGSAFYRRAGLTVIRILPLIDQRGDFSAEEIIDSDLYVSNLALRKSDRCVESMQRNKCTPSRVKIQIALEEMSGSDHCTGMPDLINTSSVHLRYDQVIKLRTCKCSIERELFRSWSGSFQILFRGEAVSRRGRDRAKIGTSRCVVRDFFTNRCNMPTYLTVHVETVVLSHTVQRRAQ
jgi:hypothetical protein